VLRLRDGCPVELFDGRGAVAHGRITRTTSRTVSVQVERTGRIEPVRPAVHVAFAVPKAKRLDWLLEKATELGATSLQPVIFERSVAGRGALSQAKRQRWLGRCVAAGKQCGVGFLPRLAAPPQPGDLPAPPGQSLALLGDSSEAASLLVDVLFARKDAAEVFLLIGPEGGLTESERCTALGAGFVPVRLGANTLRIETATIALLAAIRTLCAPPPASAGGKTVPLVRDGG
jgi:16S rRNA (uracil1498-N3)-methyltransferase